MSNNYIATTPSANLHIVSHQGMALNSCHKQIVDMLKNRLEGDEEIGSLFAEPVINEGDKSIDWYTGLPGRAKPVSALSDEERQTVQAEFDKKVAAITKMADEMLASGDNKAITRGSILKKALLRPTKGTLYAINGKPVLVCWGFTDDGLNSVQDTDIDRDAKARAEAAATADVVEREVPEEGTVTTTTTTVVTRTVGTAGAAGAAVAAPVAATATRSSLGWLWWLLLPFLLAQVFLLWWWLYFYAWPYLYDRFIAGKYAWPDYLAWMLPQGRYPVPVVRETPTGIPVVEIPAAKAPVVVAPAEEAPKGNVTLVEPPVGNAGVVVAPAEESRGGVAFVDPPAGDTVIEGVPAGGTVVGGTTIVGVPSGSVPAGGTVVVGDGVPVAGGTQVLVGDPFRIPLNARDFSFIHDRRMGIQTPLLNEAGQCVSMHITFKRETDLTAKGSVVVATGKQVCEGPARAEFKPEEMLFSMRTEALQCPNGNHFEPITMYCRQREGAKDGAANCILDNKGRQLPVQASIRVLD